MSIPYDMMQCTRNVIVTEQQTIITIARTFQMSLALNIHKFFDIYIPFSMQILFYILTSDQFSDTHFGHSFTKHDSLVVGFDVPRHRGSGSYGMKCTM